MTKLESPDLKKQIVQIKLIVNDIQDSINRKKSISQSRETIESLSSLSQQLVQLEMDLSRTVEERDNLLTLADIGSTINSSLQKNEILNEVIDKIIDLTGAERCFLMLRDDFGELKIVIGRNWKQENLTPQEKAISSTVVNRVVESGEPILTTNAQEDPRFEKQASIVDFKLRSIMCVPFMTKGEVIGTIYADNRSVPEQFNPAKLKLLDAFTNQAAIALQNANLFEGLQNTLEELQDAYTSTLEGWAKALELRDDVTEGHTQRVTKLTLELASEMKIDEKDLIHIQRGAILHDIGKIGIPDRILHKPGELNKEDWTIMRQHPNYAFEMLSKIEFLKPALDIPLCHHEKWDGNGYPRKLKGNEIPLAARIFSVVDVWDAMTSDQPYRKALSKQEVVEFIKEQTGKYFDPKIVKAFLELITSINYRNS
jgi:putative nucleotidyltransferase with HDIG domain